MFLHTWSTTSPCLYGVLNPRNIFALLSPLSSAYFFSFCIFVVVLAISRRSLLKRWRMSSLAQTQLKNLSRHRSSGGLSVLSAHTGGSTTKLHRYTYGINSLTNYNFGRSLKKLLLCGLTLLIGVPPAHVLLYYYIAILLYYYIAILLGFVCLNAVRLERRFSSGIRQRSPCANFQLRFLDCPTRCC